ncbi:MAG: PDZ domain-containing protein [Planctomycetota bacterium]
MNRFNPLIQTVLICLVSLGLSRAADVAEQESAHLKNIRRLTFAGSKNGEAYFSPDGKEIVFQGVREEGNPFYQIYKLDLATGKSVRISTGTGKTTCSFFHPTKNRILFASTHLDAESVAKQKEEIEKQKAGKSERYNWNFDPNFDIFESDPDGKNLVQLTDAKGYDAECAYSPDGKSIVFCSWRDGDGEIYVMDADGKNQRRLTTEKHYDGGPFFSPDSKKIVWRRFEDEAQTSSEIWIMDADGANKKKITSLNSVSWAPYWHPSMKWIVFGSRIDDPSFDLYAIRPDGTELTRLTFAAGFDSLPAISPDGRKIMWTSNRAENKSHIVIADLSFPGIEDTFVAPAQNDRRIFTDEGMFDRVRTLNDANVKSQVEHSLASQFHSVGLKPFGSTENIDDTFFIYGPRITGWLPPEHNADSMLITAASMGGVDWSPWGAAALIETVKAEVNSSLKAKRTAYPAIYVTVGTADETDTILKSALSDTKKTPLKTTAFVSALRLGNMRGRTLQIVGTGTGSGWRELIERLAALHPELSIETIESPESATELKQFTDKNIPAISFGGPDIPADKQDEGPGRDNFAMVSAAAAIEDTISMIASGEFKIAFTAYDAVKAQAAASATKRPYLGTIPDFKAEGNTGVLLSGVRDGSPAQTAGIKAGDTILELAGKPIKNAKDYLDALESLKPGDETTLKFQRDGKDQTIKITLGAR